MGLLTPLDRRRLNAKPEWPLRARCSLVRGDARSVWEHQLVKIVQEIVLVDAGAYSDTNECKAAMAEIREGISGVKWPPGSDRFTIYPQSGKKSGEGSGVGPIKKAFITQLLELGWLAEADFPVATAPGGARFGGMDASKVFADHPPFIVEWETGNISSSHRALNKISLGLMRGALSGGVLVVPSSALARYLTDRIGNVRELIPYLELWQSITVENGYFAIVVVEHDDTSWNVMPVAKGTDGRARQGRAALTPAEQLGELDLS